MYGSNNFLLKFEEYYSTTSTKDKIRIRYGDQKVEEYENTFSSRKRGKIVSQFSQQYWLDNGYSQQEAVNKISAIQKQNSSNRTKDSYKNFSLKTKISIDHWVNIGYTVEEAEILRNPFLLNCKNDLDSLILKYGDEIGYKKYKARCIKYTKSIKENLSSRRTGGYVSKESLKFFIPLYKFCRKLNIDKNDIYFGISGSREFFIKDKSLPINGGYFYDFCIPKLNIVVEYHGIFWHPKNIDSWRNPFSSFLEAKSKDEVKQLLAEQFGFDYYIVWSDDNKQVKFNELCNIIRLNYEKKVA